MLNSTGNVYSEKYTFMKCPVVSFADLAPEDNYHQDTGELTGGWRNR